MQVRVSRHFAAVVIAAILGATLGCSNKPNDAKIATDIQASFNNDSGLQGKQLGVQAANGTVTLSGSVNNETERDAAARYAAAVPGVKQVVNNLQIGNSGTPEVAQAQPAPAPAGPAAKPSPSRRHHRRDSSPDDEAPPPDNEAPPPAVAQMDSSQAPAAAPPSPSAVPATPAPPPPPQKVTIPSGTALAVRLVDTIDSETAQEGQTFHATLNAPLAVDGQTVIPAGYDVEGHVVSVQSAGKFEGKSELTLQLDRISVAGAHYELQTDQYHREGSSRGKNTAEKVGAVGVLGAIIGGIAGGGKGAAIGAAAGAGAGGGVQAASKSQQIKLPSEMVLNFTLQQPVVVIPTTTGPNDGRRRLDSNQ